MILRCCLRLLRHVVPAMSGSTKVSAYILLDLWLSITAGRRILATEVIHPASKQLSSCL